MNTGIVLDQLVFRTDKGRLRMWLPDVDFTEKIRFDSSRYGILAVELILMLLSQLVSYRSELEADA